MLAEHSPKSIHIQVDQVREMMVSGIHLPGRGGWSDEATRQFQWGRTTASFMANLYASNGVDAFIDDVCVPQFFSDQYAELFKNPAVLRVLLLPSEAALIERLKRRAGPYDSYRRFIDISSQCRKTAGSFSTRAIGLLSKPFRRC
jgi:hypothetical protein